MDKSYYEFMNEITSDELFEGLLAYGMFAEKLPPIFTSVSFFEFCKKQSKSCDTKPHRYVYYENMRNVNIPRSLAIPHPIAYLRQCEMLRDNWEALKQHFKEKTKNRSYKASRIHIRKMHETSALFRMNYSNWRVDGNPEVQFGIGKRYVVRADISTCFPSIYTHALSWALAGKDEAKNTKGDKNIWYHKLDSVTSNTTNGETHGLLIGPHASNLLSEIILTTVDEKLVKYDYLRHIDDYICYVETYEEAQRFLTELGAALREFDLSLNHKKTSISELPLAATKQWKRQLNTLQLEKNDGKTDFILARAYLDYAIEIMHSNGTDVAVLNYAIQTLLGKNLTKNAKEYVAKTILSYALLYPYLVVILDKHVFSVCCKECPTHSCISSFSKKLFDRGIETRNFEQSAYALFYATKYGFLIPEIDVSKLIETKDAVLLLMLYLYGQKFGLNEITDQLRAYAISFKDDIDFFEENWIFLYEVLSCSDLNKDWKRLKKANVSFVKDIFIW